MATSYNYDDADRLTGLTHTANGQPLAYQYTLDGNGNRTQAMVDAEPILPAALINASEPRTYNMLRNRLTGATLGGSPVAFTYDAEGQLQSKGGTAFTFDSANRLTGFGVSSYQYDGAGVGSGLASGSDILAQTVDITTDSTRSLTEDFSVGQVGLSAVGGAIGGAKTAIFGKTLVEQVAAGFVDTANQLPFQAIGSGLGK